MMFKSYLNLFFIGVAAFFAIWGFMLKIETSVYKNEKAMLITKLEQAFLEKTLAEEALRKQNKLIAEYGKALEVSKSIAVAEKRSVKKETAFKKTLVDANKSDSETITAIKDHLTNFLGEIK